MNIRSLNQGLRHRFRQFVSDQSMPGQFRPARHGLWRASVAGLAIFAAVGTASAAQADDSPSIIVTGTHIPRADPLLPAAPVSLLTGDHLRLQGHNSIEDILRDMPGIVPGIGSAVNNGHGGSASVNLRGLGGNRHLVLLDGNRMTPADLDGQFDLNNIPLALVERVDVLTGGASATYGADAITGVINLVTRKDFSGLALSAGSGISGRGDGAGLRTELTAGHNFADGRGNITVSLGYQKREGVSQGARAFSATGMDSRTGLPTGSPISAPAIFSHVNDSGADFIALGCGDGMGVACAPDVQGPRQLTTDGSRFSNTELHSPYDVNPSTLLQTPFERINLHAQGHVDLLDTLRLDMRLLYSHNRVRTRLAPSGVFTAPMEIPLNNPFLTPALRDALCQYDVYPGPGHVPLFSAAECLAAAGASGPEDPAYRSVTQAVLRRATELGPRETEHKTNYFDYQAGLSGPLLDGIDWDVKLSWGESRKTRTQSGYWRMSRLQQALLAGPDGCFDPSDGCVPVNIFAPDGGITPAMNEFLLGGGQTRTNTSMLQLVGRIAGDSGLQLPLANSPISFALGGEYRRQKASRSSDILLLSGDLGGTSGADPDVGGKYRVIEGMAEIFVPLVEGVPGFHRLTLGAGLRHAHSSIAASPDRSYSAWTWKAEGNWDVVDGLRLRGSWARAMRAPNIGELFYPAVNMPINVPMDPCAGVMPLYSPDLQAICLAQGASPGQIGSIQAPPLGQINARTGGNPGLAPERSTSWTAGVVLTPEAVPGLRLSVDYYNIHLRNAIAKPSPADILLGCFGDIGPDSASSDACLSIRRNPATGALDSGAPGVLMPLANLGGFATDGIDATLDYGTWLNSDTQLSFSLFANWTNRLRAEAVAGGGWRECAGQYSISCDAIQPRFALQQQTRLSWKQLDLALAWRLIGRTHYEDRQQAEDLALAEAGGCVDAAGSDPGHCLVHPDFRRISAASYFDLSARIRISPEMAFSLSIFNLLDRKPPIVGDTIGSTIYNSGNTYPSTYDAIGRRFRIGADLRF